MKFRPTPLAWAELAGAVALGGAAAILAAAGALEYRRSAALRDAVHARDWASATGASSGGLAAIDEALERSPDDSTLLLLKAAVVFERGDLDRAADVYRKVLKAAYDGGEAAGFAHAGLALVSLERARASDAGGTSLAARKPALAEVDKELFSAAKELHGRLEPEALLAASAIERGEHEAARSHLDACARASAPASAGGLLTFASASAEAARRMGDDEQEVRSCEQAVLLSPLRADLRDRLARAVARRTVDPRLDRDRAEQALAAARRAIAPVEPLELHRRQPLYGLDAAQTSVIRSAIGFVEARAGRLEEARATLDIARREGPADAVTLRNRASVQAGLFRAERNEMLKKGSARDTALLLEEAAKIAAPSHGAREGFELTLAAALFYAEADYHEGALRALDAASKLAPDDIRVFRAYAVFYDRWNLLKDAVDAYRRAIARGGGDDFVSAMEERVRVLTERGAKQ